MAKQEYKPLHGDSFVESFLMDVEQVEWPNEYVFLVWSPRDNTCYRIMTQNVLEHHFMRIGTGKLEGVSHGIPLDGIYLTYGEEFEYWSERIAGFAEQGYDSGGPPVCIEFDSHLFANRKRQLLTSDRNIGLLVVCRNVKIEEYHSYGGPRPTAHIIPSDE